MEEISYSMIINKIGHVASFNKSPHFLVALIISTFYSIEPKRRGVTTG
jgi:hypothetical protein